MWKNTKLNARFYKSDDDDGGGDKKAWCKGDGDDDFFCAMLMVWLFLKQPLAGVAQSPPHFLQTFLGEIKDRVSLLNIMIFFARKQTIAKQPKTTTATYSGKRKTKKNQKKKDSFTTYSQVQ